MTNPPPVQPTEDPNQIELAAKAIYALLPYTEGYGTKPAWVERGNSLKQEDCRRYARVALEAADWKAIWKPYNRDGDRILIAWRRGDGWMYVTAAYNVEEVDANGHYYYSEDRRQDLIPIKS